jgi:3-oxoacyl-[acyl-carrier protein] reductase
VFDLVGKTAVVTGATAGIGRATALGLSAAGASVLAVARRVELLDELRTAARAQRDTDFQVLSADITDSDSARQIAEVADRQFGTVDILVNNAGGSRPIEWDAAEHHWIDAMELNFHAHRRLTQAILPGMREQRWGRVINVTGSHEPMAVNASTPAKAATHMWAKALSRAVAADGITINCLAPGRIRSEQIDNGLLATQESRDAFAARYIPSGRLGEPEEFAAMVIFLASDMATYITGVVIDIDGGMSMYAY